MKIVILHADGRIEDQPERSSPPSLDELQAIVGGYIEHVHVDYEGRTYHAFVNEDGRQREMPINVNATLAVLRFGHGQILGPCAIVITRSDAELQSFMGA